MVHRCLDLKARVSVELRVENRVEMEGLYFYLRDPVIGDDFEIKGVQGSLEHFYNVFVGLDSDQDKARQNSLKMD